MREVLRFTDALELEISKPDQTDHVAKLTFYTCVLFRICVIRPFARSYTRIIDDGCMYNTYEDFLHV